MLSAQERDRTPSLNNQKSPLLNSYGSGYLEATVGNTAKESGKRIDLNAILSQTSPQLWQQENPGNYSEAFATADFNQYLPSSISGDEGQDDTHFESECLAPQDSFAADAFLMNNIKNALVSDSASDSFTNNNKYNDYNNNNTTSEESVPGIASGKSENSKSFFDFKKNEIFFDFNDTFKTHLSKAEYDLFNRFSHSQHVKFPYQKNELGKADHEKQVVSCSSEPQSESQNRVMNLSSELLFLDEESNNLHDSLSGNMLYKGNSSNGAASGAHAHGHRRQEAPLSSSVASSSIIPTLSDEPAQKYQETKSYLDNLERSSFAAPTYLTGASTSPISLDNVDGFKEIFFDELQLPMDHEFDDTSFVSSTNQTHSNNETVANNNWHSRDYERTPKCSSAKSHSPPMTAIKVKNISDLEEPVSLPLPIFESLELPPACSINLDFNEDIEVQRGEEIDVQNFGGDLHNSLGSFGESTTTNDHFVEPLMYDAEMDQKLAEIIANQRQEFDASRKAIIKDDEYKDDTLKMNTWQKEKRESEMLFSPGEFFGVKSCQMGDLEGLKPETERPTFRTPSSNGNEIEADDGDYDVLGKSEDPSPLKRKSSSHFHTLAKDPLKFQISPSNESPIDFGVFCIEGGTKREEKRIVISNDEEKDFTLSIAIHCVDRNFLDFYSLMLESENGDLKSCTQIQYKNPIKSGKLHASVFQVQMAPKKRITLSLRLKPLAETYNYGKDIQNHCDQLHFYVNRRQIYLDKEDDLEAALYHRQYEIAFKLGHSDFKIPSYILENPICLNSYRIDETSSKVFSVYNSGNLSCSFNMRVTGRDAGDFSVDPFGKAVHVQPQSWADVKVHYFPCDSHNISRAVLVINPSGGPSYPVNLYGEFQCSESVAKEHTFTQTDSTFMNRNASVQTNSQRGQGSFDEPVITRVSDTILSDGDETKVFDLSFENGFSSSHAVMLSNPFLQKPIDIDVYWPPDRISVNVNKIKMEAGERFMLRTRVEPRHIAEFLYEVGTVAEDQEILRYSDILFYDSKAGILVDKLRVQFKIRISANSLIFGKGREEGVKDSNRMVRVQFPMTHRQSSSFAVIKCVNVNASFGVKFSIGGVGGVGGVVGKQKSSSFRANPGEGLIPAQACTQIAVAFHPKTRGVTEESLVMTIEPQGPETETPEQWTLKCYGESFGDAAAAVAMTRNSSSSSTHAKNSNSNIQKSHQQLVDNSNDNSNGNLNGNYKNNDTSNNVTSNNVTINNVTSNNVTNNNFTKRPSPPKIEMKAIKLHEPITPASPGQARRAKSSLGLHGRGSSSSSPSIAPFLAKQRILFSAGKVGVTQRQHLKLTNPHPFPASIRVILDQSNAGENAPQQDGFGISVPLLLGHAAKDFTLDPGHLLALTIEYNPMSSNSRDEANLYVISTVKEPKTGSTLVEKNVLVSVRGVSQ